MNLNQTIEHSIPYRHWEFFNCLDDLTLAEIVDAVVPEGET